MKALQDLNPFFQLLYAFMHCLIVYLQHAEGISTPLRDYTKGIPTPLRDYTKGIPTPLRDSDYFPMLVDERKFRSQGGAPRH